MSCFHVGPSDGFCSKSDTNAKQISESFTNHSPSPSLTQLSPKLSPFHFPHFATLHTTQEPGLTFSNLRLVTHFSSLYSLLLLSLPFRIHILSNPFSNFMNLRISFRFSNLNPRYPPVINFDTDFVLYKFAFNSRKLSLCARGFFSTTVGCCLFIYFHFTEE